MIFSLGPVVRYELITTARRGRLYIVRVLYGLCLLGQLGSLFAGWESMHRGAPCTSKSRRSPRMRFSSLPACRDWP